MVARDVLLRLQAKPPSPKVGRARYDVLPIEDVATVLYLFTNHLFNDLICSTSVSISSGVSLLAYLGMRPLPFVMMLRRSSSDAAPVLSEVSDGPPKWRPSAVFPWHLAQLFL